MSRLFKSARVVLDDETFLLSSKIEKPEPEEVTTVEHHESTLEAVNQVMSEAKREAENVLDEADREAAEIESRAQKNAEAIVSKAYDEAKGIMEKAKADGFDEGYQKGISESEAIGQQIINEALSLRDAWHLEREKLYKETEREMIDLVLETVEKILNKRIETDEALIEGLIQASIRKMTQVSTFTLRVSPDDFNFALSIKPKILSMTEKIEDIEIRQDMSLKQGACVVDSDAGSIDSSMWTQYDQIREVFESLLKSE